MLPYEETIRRLLAEVLELPDAGSLGVTEDLLSRGLDSLNCMDLIVSLEETFDLEVPEEKLGLRAVRSIAEISQLISEERGHDQA